MAKAAAKGRDMGKTQRKAVLALSAGAIFAAVGCAREEIGVPRFSAADCRVVDLEDRASGAAIVGAEDLAVDPETGRLFVSAYDRRAAEKAARRPGAPPPSGGVYVVSLDELFAPGAAKIVATPLASPSDFADGLRPHGVSYDAANHELVFINRAYARDGRRWKMTPQVMRVGANGEAFVGAPETAHCAANDVVAESGRVTTSFDHGGCGLGASVENMFGLKSSGVVSDDGGLFARMRFANGLTAAAGGVLVAAATREDALIMLRRAGDGFIELGRIETPGGPDNLSMAPDGRVVAAVHPSLFRLMLERRYGVGAAPSRIIAADLRSGDVELLYDDPDGTLLSAATAGVVTPSGLAAGSVTDAGLLVCRTDP